MCFFSSDQTRYTYISYVYYIKTFFSYHVSPFSDPDDKRHIDANDLLGPDPGIMNFKPRASPQE